MVVQVQQQQKPRTWRKGTIGRRKNLERWDPLIAAGVARYKGLPEDRLRRACVVYTGSKTESYTRLSIFFSWGYLLRNWHLRCLQACDHWTTC